MRKLYCCLGLIITLPAFGENLALTTLEYVEDVLDDYQDTFELDDYTNGAETLVTIDSTEDSGINAMSIVDTVGTNPDDNAHVPTTGAVVTGLNGRQTATVNLSNQNVVTYSGTAGTITATPIYNSTTNTFANGLVTAGTLNSAVSDAANSKVTCYQHTVQNDPSSDCLLWQINTTPTNPLTTTVNLPANVAGTTFCRKSHDNASNAQGGCPAATYNALNNGEWATVFSYGTVRGISMCTNISSDVHASIPTNQSDIQTAYDNWVSSGRPSATSSFAGGYCYCKVTDPVVSAARWVFRGSFSVPGCANGCAYYCAAYALSGADFRGALFSGTPAQ